MKPSGVVGIAILALVCILALTWIVQGNEFFLYKFWGPKTANVQREVFESTRSFKQGMIQELQNMQFDYAKADSAGKATLAPIIIHRAADFPEDQMPQDLRDFLRDLRQKQMSPGQKADTSAASLWK